MCACYSRACDVWRCQSYLNVHSTYLLSSWFPLRVLARETTSRSTASDSPQAHIYFYTRWKQDVIQEYQQEYVEYMHQHHYGYPPEDEDVAEDFVEHFYKKPLHRPHHMACRDHEPGMMGVDLSHSQFVSFWSALSSRLNIHSLSYPCPVSSHLNCASRRMLLLV